MSYLADVTNALSQSNGQGSSHLSVDGEERAIEVDSDWVEELAVEEEDSQAEDSVSAEWGGNGCPACPLCSSLWYSSSLSGCEDVESCFLLLTRLMPQSAFVLLWAMQSRHGASLLLKQLFFSLELLVLLHPI